MTLPTDLADMVIALSRLLPALPEDDRKEYLMTIMILLYDMGVVQGKFQILERVMRTLKDEQEITAQEIIAAATKEGGTSGSQKGLG